MLNRNYKDLPIDGLLKFEASCQNFLHPQDGMSIHLGLLVDQVQMELCKSVTGGESLIDQWLVLSLQNS